MNKVLKISAALASFLNATQPGLAGEGSAHGILTTRQDTLAKQNGFGANEAVTGIGGATLAQCLGWAFRALEHTALHSATAACLTAEMQEPAVNDCRKELIRGTTVQIHCEEKTPKRRNFGFQ